MHDIDGLVITAESKEGQSAQGDGSSAVVSIAVLEDAVRDLGYAVGGPADAFSARLHDGRKERRIAHAWVELVVAEMRGISVIRVDVEVVDGGFELLLDGCECEHGCKDERKRVEGMGQGASVSVLWLGGCILGLVHLQGLSALCFENLRKSSFHGKDLPD